MTQSDSGFLIINKPAGPTSHDIIDELRKLTGVKKIGHAGTLDPFASGVLIVAVEREATRRLNKFVKLDKRYDAVLRLGAVSDTYDRTGVISKKLEVNRKPDEKTIISVLSGFVGKQKQVPPMFSAKKIQGKKLYELAREGIEVKREPVDIKICDLRLLSYEWPHLWITVHCSSGTYIRSLGHDIGQALGCGAYVEELVRTAVGRFTLNEAKTVARLNEDGWQACLF